MKIRHLVTLAILLATPAALTAAAPAAEAEQILSTAGVDGGLVIHLGCGDGTLTAALRANPRLVVRGLDADEKNIATARKHIRAAGIYGPAAVRQWDGDYLPYTADMVDLVVAGGDPGVGEKEIMRVLAPRGVYLKRDGNGWKKTVKPRPKDIDEWTHYLHDAGNNAVAEDDRVGPPEHLRWKANPRWCRSHEFASSIHTLITAGGRLFGIIDEGIIGQPRGVPAIWTLIARDAFNGILLWKRPCTRGRPTALAAVGERVYAVLTRGGPLCILNAATGDTIRECTETGRVDALAVCGETVVIHTKLKGAGGKAGRHVAAADAERGKLIWREPAKNIEHFTLVADDGRVCYHDGEQLVCRNLENGKELWRAEVRGGRRGYAVMHDGVVFLTGKGTRAFSAADGKPLWKGPNASGHARNPPGLFIAGGLVWRAWAGGHGRSFLWQPDEETRNGYDPKTGAVKKTVTAKRLVTAGHHIRCYPPKATKRYLLLNKRGVEFFDIENDNHARCNWTRGACGFGMVPANGLLYVPPSQCFCYPGAKIDGMNALVAAMRAGEDVPAPKDGRLVRGPAWPVNVGGATNENDWPTYRHDAFRSGSTKTAVTDTPVVLWKTRLAPTTPETNEPAEETATDALVLYAKDARIHGSGAQKSGDHICGWRGADTYITWKAKLETTGPQTAWILQANRGKGGSVFELRIGDEKLTGRIRHTDNWTAFTWVKVGAIRVEKPGPVTVRVTPVTQVEGRLGNVKAVAIGGEKPPADAGTSGDGARLRAERRRGELTPPVAAGGRIFVVRPDAHTLYCLDAQDGTRRWLFTADARIDSPPTVCGDLVIFGCTDGRVYCLRAADGVPAWRFRAAPACRMVTAFNQPESAWPVHGSVLFRDGRIYLTAGRSTFLDGGIHAFALDPATGKVIHEARLKSERPDTAQYAGRPFDMDGAITDILVSGPEDIYFFQVRLNPDLTIQPTERITKLGDRRVGPHLMTTDGFLDPTWFNRTYWVYGSRWPGYYFSFKGAKSGQILVFDDHHTYGLKVFRHRRGHSPEFQPGTGYVLFCDRNTTELVLEPTEIGREKGMGFSRSELPAWSRKIPIRTTGMVLAGDRLYVAGPPDLDQNAGAYEAMIGRKGARFRVVSAADGETITAFDMKEVPVFDGLIAAGGRLYLSAREGTLVCLGEK